METILNLAFKPIDWLLQWPDKDNVFLAGLYAPVDKEVSAECTVTGVLPEAVNGEFARNGPNPRFTPKGGYHWFDGDGMIHAVRIKAGKATYSNRYVRTSKLAAEEKAGGPLALNMGEFSSRVAMLKMAVHSLKTKLGLVPDMAGTLDSTANTSLEYHAGHLFALCEGGSPYILRVMCDGVIETIGRASYDGKMKTAFTAHPKHDPSTGKLYGIGYQFHAPFLTMYVLDKDGDLERQFPVDVKRAAMMHDFAITENFAIFLDLPMVVKPENILLGKMPITYDNTLGSRIGVLPLDATDSSDLKWFDMPKAFMAFHVLNAWEEKVGSDTVVKVVTCDYAAINLDNAKYLTPDHMPVPHTSTLNLNTGEATRTNLVPVPPTEGLEFPQLRRSLVGRKNRIGYAVGFDMDGRATGISKLDMQAETPEKSLVGRIDLGEFVGGEAIFIPSKQDDGVFDGEGDEDDGYLVTFVSPPDGGNSELRVWEAKTMSDEAIATVKLPVRVPLGFHALFVSEAELANQQQQQ